MSQLKIKPQSIHKVLEETLTLTGKNLLSGSALTPINF